MRSFVAHPDHGAVWITGASSGIGRALALKLAGEGYKVCVTARSHDKLVELQVEANDLPGSITVLDGDVTNAEDMENAVAAIEYHHGTLALAILNAGLFLPVRGSELAVDDFDRSFAVNLHGVVNCLVPAVHHMKVKGQGQIAVVSSIAGQCGLPVNAAYGASKAALIAMAESLKFDLDRLGIHMQLITPGFVDTPLTRGNTFRMPGPMTAAAAAEAISAGLKSPGFEIAFPKGLTFKARLMKFLPYSLYFRIMPYLFLGRRPHAALGGARPAPHPVK